MISSEDIYNVIAAIVPLYVAMILAYISVKFLKIFTPEQCSGINEFVSKFAIPLLTFKAISSNNPYEMSFKLVFSDILQKLLASILLAIIIKISKRGNLSWMIIGFSFTIPNSLIVGVPLIKAMYGDHYVGFLIQLVMLQGFIWNVVMLFFYELNSVQHRDGLRPDSHDDHHHECNNVDEFGAEVVAAAPAAQDETVRVENGEQQVVPKVEGNDNEVNVTIIQQPLMKMKKCRIKFICLKIAKNLSRNPNTHASVLGLAWACIKFRWSLEFPKVVDNSISILADGGLGMAMFSLGLFMGSQSKIIACGVKMAILTIVLRFIGGPVLMAVPSVALGIRGTLLRFAIVQASFPQAVVTFVFALMYNVNPQILSTGVTLSTVIALPVTLAYYILLSL